LGCTTAELGDADTLLSSPAAPDIGGIAFHCYQGLGQLTTLHTQYPAERIIVSECSPGIMPYSTGEVGIDATANWASAVQLWNLALDPRPGAVRWPPGQGQCTALVTVDEATHEARLNLTYHQYGQITKYVEPGATRIYATRLVTDGHGISRGLDDVAFESPDGSKVLVAYDNGRRAVRFSIEWHDRYLTYRLPREATVTFRWQ
jgi:glucosylceramidase